jgi:hypothetical protein
MTPPAELTIGTAIRSSHKRLRTVANGCERLRTVANVNATSSEHTLNAQTPRLKREPLLHIREKPKISSKSVKHPSQKVWHEPPADFIDGSAVLEKMVILFQQRVPSIDATCFPCNKYSNSATNVFCQCKHFWAKTSVNTAGKTLEKCICGICNGPVKTTCVFVLDGRVTAPYLHVFRD